MKRKQRAGFTLTQLMIWIAVIAVIISLLVSSSGSLIQFLTQQDVSIKIVHKERVVVGSGSNVSGKYLIWATGETFENTDSILFWKWNSSDLFGQILDGHKYVVRVGGWRVQYLSWYRNIIAVRQELPNSAIECPHCKAPDQTGSFCSQCGYKLTNLTTDCEYSIKQ